MNRLCTKLLALALAVLAAPFAGAVNFTSVYTQNFDSMGTAGTAAPTDWTVFAYTVGTNTIWAASIPASAVSNAGTANATLSASTAFVTTNATQGFNYALSTSTSDRALGVNPTTNQGMALQFTLTNATGAPLSGVRIGYDIRRFTAGATANELPGYWLFYSVDNGATWINVSALNPTISGSTGVVVPNTTGVTSVPLTAIAFDAPLANNSTVIFRWVDDNASQSSPDQICGLDNVVIAPPLSTPGKSALWFDGVNDYVTMGVAPALGVGGPPSNGFTIECWFRKEGTGITSSSGTGGVTAVPLFGKGRGEAENSNVDCDYFFGINTSGQLVADFEAYPASGITAGQNYPVTATNPAIVNNTWYHAAATYDGATFTWRLYLNGVQVGTAAAVANALPRYDSIQHFGIGAAMTSTGVREGAFAGRIDEVRVWNYARSAAEILAGKDVEIASAPGLVGRYGLDEGAGTVTTNSAGVAGAPTGTLTNGPLWIDGPSFVPNVLPSVQLTAPVSGGNVISPASVDFAANAADSDGTIAKIEFYDGAIKVGEDLTAPYTYSWMNAAVGTHVLSAKAFDNSGGSATSATVTFDVLANPNQPANVIPAGPINNATGVGSSTSLDVGLDDPEGDALTVTYYGRNAAPATPAPDFSIIAVPDTQYYSENINSHVVNGSVGANASIYYAQTQWIADNQATRKIAFVSHMGDIAQNGDTNQSEWIVADTAMKTIENPALTLRAHGIPWGVAPGNHDQGTTGNGDAGAQANFYTQYFNFNRWDSRPYYGGHFGTKSGVEANTNSYQLFSAGGLDFVIVHLEYDVRALSFYQPVLDWADAVLQAFPNRRAIITSHWIVNTGNPATFSAQGQNIYDALKHNPNLFLMLCGHVNGEGFRSDTYNGHTVYSILQDYQETTNGGNGFLRIYTFSPTNNTITLESYSPTLNRAINAGDSIPQGNFAPIVLPYNMQSAVTDWIPLGTVNVAAGGTSARLNWTGLEAGKNYEWYASVSDGVNTTTTATNRFSTASASAPTVTIDAPLNGGSFTLPAPITISATANDADNNIVKVEFFDGVTKLGEATTAPYSLTWTNATSGSHALTVVVTDNTGLDAVSSVATVTVVNPANVAPTVTLSAPVDGSTVVANTPVSLTANATDADGSIAKVEFYLGTTKLGEDLTSPYTLSWTGGPVGNYAFTARATDNDGSVTTSAVVNVSVIPAGALVTTYTQDFNSLGAAGTTAPAAWTIWNGTTGTTNATWTDSIPIIGGASSVPNSVGTLIQSTAALTVSAAPTTTNNAGYNAADPADSTNRILATSPTSTNGVALQLELTNVGANGVTAISVAYDIRRFTAATATNELPGYSLFYSLDSGLTWTNVPALTPTVAGPTGVIVPNTVGVTNVAAATINLPTPWAVNGILRLRWVDDNAVATSPDQIIGLDNVSVTATQFEIHNGAAPTVSIASPVDGATFTTPVNVELTANAADSDGTVSKVEFFQGSTKLGEATSSPFTYAWTNVSVGTYTLTAKATDDVGNVTTSTAVAITVALPPGGSGSLLRGPYLNMANQNSIVVRWRSSLSTVGRVRYGNAPDNLTQFLDESSTKTDHEVRLTGLTPYTRYYYSVGSAVDSLTPETADTTTFRPASVPAAPSAADYTFRTSPTPGTATDTRIWVVGDCGRGSTSQASGRDAYYTWMGSRVPDLNLQMGDNAYNSGTDVEYQTGYFLMYPSIFRKMPQWSTLGNHDANNGVTNPATNFPYFDMFTFPTAGEAGGVASGTEHYYSFDYGNIHFISLDSQASSTNTIEKNGSDGPMAAWLRQDLAATTATWIIAFWHHPPYSKGSHDSDTEGQMVNMRTNFNPILEAGGVDLVLNGHSHNYERSVLLDGNYGITTTITPAMKLNAGNGSTTGFTTGPNGVIRNASTGFNAVATVSGAVIAPDGAYRKPLTGPRDHFGAVYNTAGMSGQADGGSLNHTAMYISYNSVGTVNLDINGNTLVATYVQAGGTAPDNYTIVKQGAADSDSDGIPDDYEIANGLNRGSALDADLDLDGDGLSNRLEYALGTAANSPNRAGLPVLGQGAGADVGKLTLTFNRARAELTYIVQASDDLKVWADIASNPGVSGSPVTVTDANTTSLNRFLRLKITDGVASATTTPVGRITYSLAQNQETAVSFPLHDVLGALSGQPAGFITGIGANTVDNSNAGWTPGQLSQGVAPYYLHVTSGAASGLMFPVATASGSENSATRLVLVTGGVDLTTLGIVAGIDTYELVPADTLANLFPTGTLLAGTSTTGDTLRLWNGSTWITYYNDGVHWQRDGAGIADNTLVRPDQGWMLLRRGPAKNLVLFGEVSSTNAKAGVQQGGSSYISLLPVSQTFAEFPLQTLLPNWSSNPASPTAGDYVRLWNGSVWLNYYYSGTKWMRQGAGDASTTVLLKPGRPVFIVRPAGVGSDLLNQNKTY